MIVSMLRFSMLLALPAALAGCLSVSRSDEPARVWTIDSASAGQKPAARKARHSATRLGAVTVMTPFDRIGVTVRRADGTVVEDPFNRFAAQPAALMRAPALAALAADGRFGIVVNRDSAALTSATAELTVGELALDCRQAGSRRAAVTVRLDVIADSGRTRRDVVASAMGAGSADAASGDYTAAFTAAFDEAIRNALAALREREVENLDRPRP